MELNKVYFFTATVKEWIPLFNRNECTEIVIESLKYLVNKKSIKLYGFVIMPNHIHLLWEMLEMNGKELPNASFMKFTSHQFLKYLRGNNIELIQKFKVDLETRNYQFWQRDAMTFEAYSPNVIHQKLEYIHNNPVQGKWMLCKSPIEYEYSSANFYETGKDDFNMLTHIGDRL
jgi:REP-associated tyrosine transposase